MSWLKDILTTPEKGKVGRKSFALFVFLVMDVAGTIKILSLGEMTLVYDICVAHIYAVLLTIGATVVDKKFNKWPKEKED